MGRPPEGVLGQAGGREVAKRVRRGVRADGDPDHSFHGRQAAVGVAVEEERRGVDIVVPGVGVFAVRAAEPGLAGEDVAVRVGGFEGAPPQDLGWERREAATGEFADDRLACDLLPPALRLAVPHDQIAVAQVAGRAEVVHGAIRLQAAVEGDGGVAERAERHEPRPTAEHVVDNLVPDHDLQGIGPRHTGPIGLVLGQGDHRLGRIQPAVRISDRDGAGIVDGGNPVARGATGQDLVQRHAGAGEVRRPPAGVDAEGAAVLQGGRGRRSIGAMFRGRAALPGRRPGHAGDPGRPGHADSRLPEKPTAIDAWGWAGGVRHRGLRAVRPCQHAGRFYEDCAYRWSPPGSRIRIRRGSIAIKPSDRNRPRIWLTVSR